MVTRTLRLISEVQSMPVVSVNLMCLRTKENDPFYERVVRSFYREKVMPHPKFPLVRRGRYETVTRLDEDFNSYFMRIEAAARRNYKKADRLGYSLTTINYNEHLGDITEILRSTKTRQGRPMPKEFFEQPASAIEDPPSRCNVHDYPYFGVIRDGRLYAYASCLVAGEICSIETIYGHAEHLSDGIVPLLIIGIAQYVMQNYPGVKFYGYGGYLGAGESMKRFKAKFDFKPHKVDWILGDKQ